MEEKPVELSLDDIDPEGGGIVIGKARLSEDPNPKHSIVIFPETMSRDEATALIRLLAKAMKTVQSQHLQSKDGREDYEDHDFIEMHLRSGRSTCLAVPKGATEEELLEIRGDIVSLVQEGVLEDAIMEAKGQPIASTGDMN